MDKDVIHRHRHTHTYTYTHRHTHAHTHKHTHTHTDTCTHIQAYIVQPGEYSEYFIAINGI